MSILEAQQLISELEHLPPEELAFLAAFYGSQIAAALFAARTLYVAIGRLFGFYSPEHYSMWPRVPWRPFVILWLRTSEIYERLFLMGKRSTAGFASTLSTLTNLYRSRPGELFLGRASLSDIPVLMPLGAQIETHAFLYGKSGSGKTALLLSIVSLWKGSCFLIDAKNGEISETLAPYDKRRTWYVISPYSPDTSACFNVFDLIKEEIERNGGDIGIAVKWAMRISEALIRMPPDSKQPYFYLTPQAFLAGVILLVLLTHHEEEHNLVVVYKLIVNGYRVYDDDGSEIDTTEDERMELLFRALDRVSALDDAVRESTKAFSVASGDTKTSLYSTLFSQLQFLSIPSVKAILRSTTIPLSQLKTRDDVVLSFTASLFSIREELSPLSRLLTNMIAYSFESVPDELKRGQCLTVVEEMNAQGYNPVWEVTLPAARSNGQTVLGCSQNVEFMRNAYPRTWATFTGEADIVYWLSCSHKETKSFLADELGEKTIIEQNKYSGHKSYRDVKVMSPEQVGRYLKPQKGGTGHLIITRAGKRALKAYSDPYFKALSVLRYAKSKVHKEPLMRRLMRLLFDRKQHLASPATPSTKSQAEEQP